MRMLQTLCILPNMNLLVEGGMLDQCIEVYKLDTDTGYMGEPF